MADANLPLAPRNRSWDGPAARRRMIASARNEDDTINVREASRGFLYVLGDGQRQADYKSPFADIIDGELRVVRGGLIAARQRNNQVDGISAEQRERGDAFLVRQLERFNDSETSTTPTSTLFTMPLVQLPSNININGQPWQSVVALGSSELLELRQMIEANQVAAIGFDSLTFHADVDNANNFLFRDEDLPFFANSFANVPFLRDHFDRAIDSREGTVIGSKLVGKSFLQNIMITAKRGMLAFSEGKIDRFSIGFDYNMIQCTTCLDNWFHCPHWPGHSYEFGGDMKLCQLLFIEPVGIETSAVNIPAVPGTGILAQLNRLAIDKPQFDGKPIGRSIFLNQLTKSEAIKMDDTQVTPQPTEEGQTLANSTVDTASELTTNETNSTLVNSIVNQVLQVIGSEESTSQLAASLGILEVVGRLNEVVDQINQLSNDVQQVQQLSQVLEHNVGVLAGDPIVSNVAVPQNIWTPVPTGLSTTIVPTGLQTPTTPQVPPQSIRQPSNKQLTGTSMQTQPITATSQDDETMNSRASKTIARMNARRLRNGN